MTIKEYERRIKNVVKWLNDEEFCKTNSGNVEPLKKELIRLQNDKSDLMHSRKVKTLEEKIAFAKLDVILYAEDNSKEVTKLERQLEIEKLVREFNLKCTRFTAFRFDTWADNYPIYFQHITELTLAEFYVCIYVDGELDFVFGVSSFTIKELTLISNLLSKVYRKEKEWKKYDGNNP